MSEGGGHTDHSFLYHERAVTSHFLASLWPWGHFIAKSNPNAKRQPRVLNRFRLTCKWIAEAGRGLGKTDSEG